MPKFPSEMAGFEMSVTAGKYMFYKIFINSFHYKSKILWQVYPKGNSVSISCKSELKKPILLLDPTNRNNLHICLR